MIKEILAPRFLMVRARVLLLIKENRPGSGLWRALCQDRKMAERGINMCFSLSLAPRCPNNVLYNWNLAPRPYAWRDSLCVTAGHSAESEGGGSARGDRARSCLLLPAWSKEFEMNPEDIWGPEKAQKHSGAYGLDGECCWLLVI